MSRERIEHETLAAFLDGKLEGAERERVLRIIAETPEDYEVFADAARAASDLRGGAVVPIQSRRRGGWKLAIPLLAAAGLGAIVLLPRGGGVSPGELAGLLNVAGAPGPGSLATALGPAWDQPGWSVMRGSAVDATESARAFRLGVRATDLEIAVRAADTTALRIVGAELIDLLAGVEAGSPAAEQYRRIVDAGSAAPEPDRRDAAESVRNLMGASAWYDVGAWVEAARVAALAGDLGGLRSIGASVRGISRRVSKEPGALRNDVFAGLQELETLVGSGAVLDQNRQRVLEVLSRIILAVGR